MAFAVTSRALHYVDLFSGLGGFHLALRRLGHKCVFACEIDENLRELYWKNFGLLPAGDIRQVVDHDIPKHDVLCAGFPCQPFSKAGDQAGTQCPKWGDLFDHVTRIIRSHRPQYVLLENVPNLQKHKNGQTWETMMANLSDLGYAVDAQRLSPHNFGIPQIRERVFIVGSRSQLDMFQWPTRLESPSLTIRSKLDRRPADARKLSPRVVSCLEVWQEFLTRYPTSEEIPSFPIWAMEFGATYPYQEVTPFAVGTSRLRRFRGSLGVELGAVPAPQRMRALPGHARCEELVFPDWKIQFIRSNRALYARHKKWIDKWLPKIGIFPSSLQKLEWNCKGDPRDIWHHVIQFRASGVRVRRPTTSPSLVAMTSTQVPIIGWERRYLTPQECARLQSMEELIHLPESPTRCYKALGNAVNVHLVERIAESLLISAPSQRESRAAMAERGDGPVPPKQGTAAARQSHRGLRQERESRQPS